MPEATRSSTYNVIQKGMNPREAKLRCPFCRRKRTATVINLFGGRYFSTPPEEALPRPKGGWISKPLFLQTDLPCECGASWYVGGGKIPEQHVAVKVSKEVVAVKPYVTINEVKLKGKKKGRLYRWKQMQLRFPRALQTVKSGEYAVYHDGEDIILKPVTGDLSVDRRLPEAGEGRGADGRRGRRKRPAPSPFKLKPQSKKGE